MDTASAGLLKKRLPSWIFLDPSGIFTAQTVMNNSRHDDFCKGYITWDKTWSEVDSYKKAYCLELFTMEELKP